MSTTPTPQLTAITSPAPAGRGLRAVVIIGIVAAVLFTGFIAVVGGYLFFTRSHQYNAIAMDPLHLTATLDAPFAGGVVDFHFKASLQPDHERDIRDALEESTDMPYKFVLKLLDSGGNTVCSVVPKLVRFERFDAGIGGVEARGTFPDCNLTQFRRASRWDVAYQLPRGLRVPTTHITYGEIVGPTSTKLPYPNGTVDYVTMRGTDYLTGTIELMKPDRELSAPNDADLDTLRHWQVQGPVIINCQEGDCVLLNTRQGGSVHVRNIH